MRTWLKEARLKRNLTCKQMGERMGITESAYFYIEQGKRQNPMGLDIVSKLATALDMDVSIVVKKETEH